MSAKSVSTCLFSRFQDFYADILCLCGYVFKRNIIFAVDLVGLWEGAKLHVTVQSAIFSLFLLFLTSLKPEPLVWTLRVFFWVIPLIKVCSSALYFSVCWCWWWWFLCTAWVLPNYHPHIFEWFGLPAGHQVCLVRTRPHPPLRLVVSNLLFP